MPGTPARPVGVWKWRYIKGVGDVYENVETGVRRSSKVDIPDADRVVSEADWEAEEAERRQLEQEQKMRDPLVPPEAIL